MACNLISFSCVKKLSTVVFLLSIMLPWIGKAPSPRILFLLAGARDVLTHSFFLDSNAVLLFTNIREYGVSNAKYLIFP